MNNPFSLFITSLLSGSMKIGIGGSTSLDFTYCLHNAARSVQMGGKTVPDGFDPMGSGGVIHERRHSLTWMLSKGIDWDDTDLST